MDPGTGIRAGLPSSGKAPATVSACSLGPWSALPGAACR
jgi:hypothetical protein